MHPSQCTLLLALAAKHCGHVWREQLIEFVARSCLQLPLPEEYAHVARLSSLPEPRTEPKSRLALLSGTNPGSNMGLSNISMVRALSLAIASTRAWPLSTIPLAGRAGRVSFLLFWELGAHLRTTAPMATQAINPATIATTSVMLEERRASSFLVMPSC